MRWVRRGAAVMALGAVAMLVYAPLVVGHQPPAAPVITNLRDHPITTISIDHSRVSRHHRHDASGVRSR
jgi:hypothetical protein